MHKHWAPAVAPPQRTLVFEPARAVLRAWRKAAWRAFTGPNGYLFIATLIAGYVGVYSIVEARHERMMNRAALQQTAFLTLLSSGNVGARQTAARMYKRTRDVTIVREPPFFLPFIWLEEFRPAAILEAEKRSINQIHVAQPDTGIEARTVLLFQRRHDEL